MENKQIKNIEKDILEIKKIFDKWKINKEDWALMIHFSDILQGYNLKKSLRSGPPHYNIIMKASALPWKYDKSLLGIDTTIPKNSMYAKDVSEFHRILKADFDIVLESDEYYNSFSEEFVNHKIGNQKVTLLSVFGDLMYTKDGLEKHFEEWGSKSQRILLKTKEISELAKKKNHKKIFIFAQKILSKFKMIEKNDNKTNKVKGTVAYSGKVIGKALVITDKDKDPIKKVLSIKEGMILVIPISRPSYISAIEKCSAIVTDEGGSLSHAAIIAREQKKPCIIGTKNATQIIKDGEIIEVNADIGEVKTLSSKWVLRWESVHPHNRIDIFMNGHVNKKVLGSDYSKLLAICKDKKVQMYYSQEDLDRKSAQALKLFKDTKKVCDYIRLIKNNNTELIKNIKSILKDKEILSNKELAKKYSAFIENFKLLFAAYDLSRPEFFESIEKEIKNNLKRKVHKKDLDTIFSLLTTNNRKNLLDKEELDRLDIALRIHEHQKKYGWIGTSDSENEWDVKYFKKEIDKDLKLSKEKLKQKIKRKKVHKTELKKTQKEIINRLEINKSIEQLIEFVKIFSQLRLSIRLKWIRAGYLNNFIFREIEKRTDVKQEMLERYKPEEIIDLLRNNNKVSAEEIKARYNYAYLLKNDELNFFSGDAAKKLKNREIQEENYSKIKEVKGTVANKGYVKARVKIISAMTNDQEKAISEMKKGEILVVSMTRPHLIFAMKKASAIVTDEGGIASHASIIARELGKPCIIGTKIATKVFKDGDLVEFDGEKGVVRKSEE